MKPQINATNGVVRLDWPNYLLAAEVSRTRQHRDGRVIAEVKITTTAPGVPPLLHQAQLNLTSTRSRKDLEGVLSNRYETVNWTQVMEQLCYFVLEEIRKGEPVEEIDTDDEYEPPRYLLNPLLPLSKPTVIFGQGGTMKSYLGLAIASCVSLPWSNNPLGLECLSEPTRVLYLDYETDRQELGWRMKCMAKGMELPRMRIKYRRCAAILSDDIEEIKKIIDANEIGLIIVDSLGLACGGELKESQPAIALFGAIRHLRVTSLLITHTTKPTEGQKQATPYGSAFFGNYSRSVWEIKKAQEPGADYMDIGLFHAKVNASKLFAPIGLHIAFTDDSVVMRRRSLAEVSEFSKRVPIRLKIIGLLRKEPTQRSVKFISDYLEEDMGTIRKTLDRMRDAKEVERYGEVWGLLSKDPF